MFEAKNRIKMCKWKKYKKIRKKMRREEEREDCKRFEKSIFDIKDKNKN